METRLSIIVPVLNEEAGITETLQPLQPWRAGKGINGKVEIILVDGGSRDRTVDVSRGLVDIQLTALRGRALQMNAGAVHASGEWLLFLHGDTRLPADFLDQLPGSGAGDWGFFPLSLTGRGGLLRLVAWSINLRSRLTGIGTGDQALFIRHRLFKSIGGFPDIPLMEDVEISKTLRARGRPRFATSRVVTSNRRWEKHGVWRTVLLMWRLRLAYFLGVPPERLVSRYY